MNLKFATMTALACAAASLQAGDEIALSKTWLAQPAASVAEEPDAKAWSPCQGSLGPANVKGTKFAAAGMDGVDSAWFEQKTTLPESWRGSRVAIDFKRLEGDAIVFVNGRRAGEVLRPGGELEASELFKPGEENSLRIFVTRDYSGISRGFEKDFLRYAARTNKSKPLEMRKWPYGVSAGVSLLRRPAPVAITDLTTVSSFRGKSIRFDLELDATKDCEGLSARFEVSGMDGKPVFAVESPEFGVKAGRGVTPVETEWTEPRLWELDSPYLYTVKATLLQGGKPLDAAKPEKFGFREIWVEGRKIFINGHEARFRLSSFWTVASGGAGHVDFLRLVGYNAGYVQAHSGLWWGSWFETPLIDEELLARCDETGFAVFLPSPTAREMTSQYIANAELRKDFERETRLFIRKYKSHPAVLGWMTSMNGYIGELYRGTQSPQGMGHRFTDAEVASSKTLTATKSVCETVKAIDPTRLAFAHAEGGVGDVATSNVYLNFVPLQEREEWPMRWSASGEMPFMSVETGQPHIGNFWKGRRFLLTEYLAMQFGEEAYAKEPEELLKRTMQLGATIDEDGQGDCVTDKTMDGHPLYWEFQRIYVGATNKAWRLWDFNGGWSYWLVSTHYGCPPWESPTQSLPLVKIYNKVRKGIDAKPEWANPNFDIHRLGNQPLLACLAGWPRHTDKSHAFFAGERIEKSLAIVWDGPGACAVEARWALKDETGKELVSGSLASGPLEAGAIKRIPFAFDAPSVERKSVFSLELDPSCGKRALEKESFRIEVWPKAKSVALKSKTALYDPVGKSGAWLGSLGAETSPWKPGDSLDGVEVLIVGSEALKAGQAAPYAPSDIERGLKVLILEQLPEVWQGLGFRTTESMARNVFIADKGAALFEGLSEEDLRYWRGSSSLLPEGRTQPSEAPHAPKWTNTHGVSSTTPQTPRTVGFTPLLQCEFDMDYSPLLEWRYGKGMIAFSSLDFNGRIACDPAATELAARLLKRIDSLKLDKTEKARLAGDDAAKALFGKLGAALDGAGDSKLLLLHGKPDVSPAEALAAAKAGATALGVALDPAWLEGLGVKTAKRTLWRVQPEGADKASRALGPKLLRWRDSLEADCALPSGEGLETMAGGALARMNAEAGRVVLCQVEPSMISGKRKGDKAKTESSDLSAIRLEQLLANVLTACGASPDKAIAERLCAISAPPSFKAIPSWNVFGPFFVEKDGDAMIDMSFPGEECAVAGTPDPNVAVKRDGETLNWNRVLRSRSDGYVNLGEAFNRKTLAVGYVAANVESESERDAILRVGCDWRMKIWLNGAEVFKTTFGKNRPDSYRVKIHLKKGANAIGMKIASGSNGFSFYADLSGEEAGVQSVYSNDLKASAVLYGKALQSEEFDPYIFRYW